MIQNSQLEDTSVPFVGRFQGCSLLDALWIQRFSTSSTKTVCAVCQQNTAVHCNTKISCNCSGLCKIYALLGVVTFDRPCFTNCIKINPVLLRWLANLLSSSLLLVKLLYLLFERSYLQTHCWRLLAVYIDPFEWHQGFCYTEHPQGER